MDEVVPVVEVLAEVDKVVVDLAEDRDAADSCWFSNHESSVSSWLDCPTSFPQPSTSAA